jgi:hypothetical protein
VLDVSPRQHTVVGGHAGVDGSDGDSSRSGWNSPTQGEASAVTGNVRGVPDRHTGTPAQIGRSGRVSRGRAR